jgi:hypothetical protein
MDGNHDWCRAANNCFEESSGDSELPVFRRLLANWRVLPLLAPLLCLTNAALNLPEFEGREPSVKVTFQFARQGSAKIGHSWTWAELQIVAVVLPKVLERGKEGVSILDLPRQRRNRRNTFRRGGPVRP